MESDSVNNPFNNHLILMQSEDYPKAVAGQDDM